MKKLILTAALVASLSACTAGTPGMSVGLGLGTSIGSHLGLGTSINIPVGLGTKSQSNSNDSSINVIDEQIVTYFDAQGNTSNHAVKGGFYRQLIKKQSSNSYLVQDFYGDNAHKRTDPYTLTRDRLMTFRTHPAEGSLTTYAYNGAVMQQQVYSNDKLVSAKY